MAARLRTSVALVALLASVLAPATAFAQTTVCVDPPDVEMRPCGERPVNPACSAGPCMRVFVCHAIPGAEAKAHVAGATVTVTLEPRSACVEAWVPMPPPPPEGPQPPAIVLP